MRRKPWLWLLAGPNGAGKSTYAPKLGKALPVKKVARYLQIENKIRAVVKYDLAQGVPLVQYDKE